MRPRFGENHSSPPRQLAFATSRSLDARWAIILPHETGPTADVFNLVVGKESYLKSLFRLLCCCTKEKKRLTRVSARASNMQQVLANWEVYRIPHAFAQAWQIYDAAAKVVQNHPDDGTTIYCQWFVREVLNQLCLYGIVPQESVDFVRKHEITRSNIVGEVEYCEPKLRAELRDPETTEVGIGPPNPWTQNGEAWCEYGMTQPEVWDVRMRQNMLNDYEDRQEREGMQEDTRMQEYKYRQEYPLRKAQERERKWKAGERVLRGSDPEWRYYLSKEKPLERDEYHQRRMRREERDTEPQAAHKTVKVRSNPAGKPVWQWTKEDHERYMEQKMPDRPRREQDMEQEWRPKYRQHGIFDEEGQRQGGMFVPVDVYKHGLAYKPRKERHVEPGSMSPGLGGRLYRHDRVGSSSNSYPSQG